MNFNHWNENRLGKLSDLELKILEYIGKEQKKKGKGAKVQEVRQITQSNNSTTNSLLYHLCEVNFLVREKGCYGTHGAYFYSLQPWLSLESIQLVLAERQKAQNYQSEWEEFQSNCSVSSQFAHLLEQIESNQQQIIKRLKNLEALIQ